MASKLDPHKDEIQRKLEAGLSVSEIVSQGYGVARSTMEEFIAKNIALPNKEGIEKWLIVPDTHAPYHDERAWAVMLNAATAFRPDGVIHLGDLADFYAVSAHSKDPTRMDRLDEELVVVRGCRADLDGLGATKKKFVEGNHEDRFRRYIEDKSPELYGLLNTDSLLELSDNEWELTPYREATKIGEVYFTHDTGNSGKYTTARALDAFQHSVVIAHHHAIQYAVEGNATGTYRVGAQFGWLGDPEKADYLHRIKALRNWSPGFGIGYHDLATGLVYLVPVPIVNYTACVEGAIYGTE